MLLECNILVIVYQNILSVIDFFLGGGREVTLIIHRIVLHYISDKSFVLCGGG